MAESTVLKSNIPEFSVSELAFSLKKTLEENYGRVRVRGEIGRVTIPGSGHLYTTLKDQNACIDAVCWRGQLGKLSVRPEEGLEVICTGRVSSYPQSSKYQIIIESMELAGEGALLKMLEERRKKLLAEGLFDPARKKPLPFLPQTIGVITSPTGAVIRDILHRLSDRFPRHVLVWPVLVQGENAAVQIADAIEGFDSFDGREIPRPDIIIVARGGGSLEDLMPFNEEIVVRAVAACDIPVISAVGHETDTTLIDYAADLRAPTPTAAAEMAVPRRDELLAQVMENGRRLFSSAARLLNENRHRLVAQTAELGDPAHLLETKTQRIDHAAERLSGVFRHYLAAKKTEWAEAASALRHPRETLQAAQKQFALWAERLHDLEDEMPKIPEAKLKQAARMLESLSYKNVLERGFAVIEGPDGLITDAAQAVPGQDITLHFRKDGRAAATVKKKN